VICADDIEIIQIGEPVDRLQEMEGARLTWTKDHCELMMSFSNLKAAEVRGVEQGALSDAFRFFLTLPDTAFYTTIWHNSENLHLG